MFISRLSRSPRQGDTFAVTTGDHIGSFFIFIDRAQKKLNFLTIPKFEVLSLTKKVYKEGIKKDILEFTEQLPEEVFAEYQKIYDNLINDKERIN